MRRIRAFLLTWLLPLSVTAQTSIPRGFFVGPGPQAGPFSPLETWLLKKNHYSVSDDGSVVGPRNAGPISKGAARKLLRHLKSAQRLKALLKVDIIFNSVPKSSKLSPEEKSELVKVLRQNWAVFTVGLRREFKAYFSKAEYVALNAQSPPPVDLPPSTSLDAPAPGRTPPPPDSSRTPSPAPPPQAPQQAADYVIPSLQSPGAAAPPLYAPSMMAPVSPAPPPAADFSSPEPAQAPRAPGGGNVLVEALRQTGQSLAALAEMQKQQAALQQSFLSNQGESQKAVSLLITQQQALLARLMGPLPSGAPAAAQPPSSEPPLAPAAGANAVPAAPLAPPLLAASLAARGPLSGEDSNARVGHGVLKAKGAAKASLLEEMAAPQSNPALAGLPLPPPAPAFVPPAVPAPRYLPPAPPPQAPAPPSPQAPPQTAAVPKAAPAPAPAPAPRKEPPAAAAAPKPSQPPAEAPALLSELSKLQAQARLQMLTHTHLKDFLAEAPYDAKTKELILMISENAPSFARSRAIHGLISAVPQILYSSDKLGSRMYARTIVSPKSGGDEPDSEIILAQGTVYWEKRKFLFEKLRAFLPSSGRFYSERHIAPPDLDAVKRPLSFIKEDNGQGGRIRLYADKSERILFSKEQIAGILLRELLLVNAKEEGWNADPYGAWVYARTAMMMFFAGMASKKAPESFLDPELLISYKEWLRDPSEDRDFFVHALSGNRAGLLVPEEVHFDFEPGERPAATALKIACRARMGSYFSREEAFKQDLIPLQKLGLSSPQDVQKADEAISKDTSSGWRRSSVSPDCSKTVPGILHETRILATMAAAELKFRKEQLSKNSFK